MVKYNFFVPFEQLCKTLSKDTMDLHSSSTTPTTETYILSTVKATESLPKTEEELDHLLKAYIQIHRGLVECTIPYTTRLQKSVAFFRDTKHASAATDTLDSRTWI